jgi:hypothetical protein
MASESGSGMPGVSASYLDLASRPKGELAALFDAGTPPDVRALTGFGFRGYNQPRAAALLGIRKFIKAFFPNGQGQPFGCNTPVRQNGLEAEWIARPSPERPRSPTRRPSPGGEMKVSVVFFRRFEPPVYDRRWHGRRSAGHVSHGGGFDEPERYRHPG